MEMVCVYFILPVEEVGKDEITSNWDLDLSP